jgi:hypothetical protein
MKPNHSHDYNQRLFAGGIRKSLHLARFKWLSRKISSYCPKPSRVVEIGCFDARSIDWFPCRPQEYLGIDANWEGGIDLARKKFGDQSGFTFRSVEGYWEIPPQNYDLAISLETFEHLTEPVLEAYLDRLREVVVGHMIITVPVERGLTWLMKHGAKAALGIKRDRYSWAECWNAAWGRMGKIARDQHKGFDDRRLIQMLSKRFRILEISGITPGWGWLGWNFQVGIVCASDTRLDPD